MRARADLLPQFLLLDQQVEHVDIHQPAEQTDQHHVHQLQPQQKEGMLTRMPCTASDAQATAENAKKKNE